MKRSFLHVGVGFLLGLATLQPIAANAATSVPAKIVEPSPNGFQTWTFSPGTLTIHVGDIMVWTNTGQANHTVTDTGVFDSGNVAPGAAFSFTFSKPGSYNYQCTYHAWTKGTVEVLAAGQSAATPTASASTATLVPALPTPNQPSPTPVPPTATARPAAAPVSLAPTVTTVPATPIAVGAAAPSSPTAATTARRRHTRSVYAGIARTLIART